jgi:hypothetical protein
MGFMLCQYVLWIVGDCVVNYRCDRNFVGQGVLIGERPGAVTLYVQMLPSQGNDFT